MSISPVSVQFGAREEAFKAISSECCLEMCPIQLLQLIEYGIARNCMYSIWSKQSIIKLIFDRARICNFRLKYKHQITNMELLWFFVHSLMLIEVILVNLLVSFQFRNRFVDPQCLLIELEHCRY